MLISFVFFFFKQKTAYEMRISDWSSDVCSSDLRTPPADCAGVLTIGSSRGGQAAIAIGSTNAGGMRTQSSSGQPFVQRVFSFTQTGLRDASAFVPTCWIVSAVSR